MIQSSIHDIGIQQAVSGNSELDVRFGIKKVHELTHSIDINQTTHCDADSVLHVSGHVQW